VTDFIDGARLNAARISSATHYRELIDFYKARGATDKDLVQAMANTRTVANPLKIARSPKSAKVRRPKLKRLFE